MIYFFYSAFSKETLKENNISRSSVQSIVIRLDFLSRRDFSFLSIEKNKMMTNVVRNIFTVAENDDQVKMVGIFITKNHK